MQNTYKKGVSYFVLGIVAAQGISGYVNSDTPDSYVSKTFASMSDESEQSPFVIEREDIISDESDLQMIEKVEVVEEEKLELEAAPKEVVMQTKAEILARNISDTDLLQIFIYNKQALAGQSFGGITYDDFIAAWKTLSMGYTQKSDDIVYTQKVAFIEIYLTLNGDMNSQISELAYDGVSIDIFEEKIMKYLTNAGATDIQFSNARKLVKMVEIYNSLSDENRKTDMQKSISSQFGRVLNNL